MASKQKINENSKLREKEIPEKKLKSVAEISNFLKTKNLVIASIKNLPARQFQLIKKELRGKAEIRVVKKSAILRAIEKTQKPNVKKIKEHIKEDIALIFSELDSFELSALLSENKSRTRAKVGQIVEEEVSIEPGPTDLVPGPIISQLSSLGLKFAIEDGKISIKDKKVILKPGDKVNESAADIMAKLDLKPISVGLEPILAYSSTEDKIYENVKIDKKKTLEELKEAYSRSLAFAVKIAYYCKESITHLIRRAALHEKALKKFIKLSDQQTQQNQENIQSGG